MDPFSVDLIILLIILTLMGAKSILPIIETHNFCFSATEIKIMKIKIVSNIFDIRFYYNFMTLTNIRRNYHIKLINIGYILEIKVDVIYIQDK